MGISDTFSLAWSVKTNCPRPNDPCQVIQMGDDTLGSKGSQTCCATRPESLLILLVSFKAIFTAYLLSVPSKVNV